MRNRLFEVGVLVAIETAHTVVLSFERELRTTVVEAGRRQPHLLPTVHGVTGLASSTRLKRSIMRIVVAVGAGGEFDAAIFHKRGAIAFLMALGAIHLRMQSGKWVSGQRVVEGLRRLPGSLGMA